MNSVKAWIRGSRPFSFTGSVAPTLLGALWAYHEGSFHALLLVATLVAILFLHAGVNLFSDYKDFSNKVDVPGSYGSSGVLLEGTLTPQAARRGGLIFIIAGTLLGIGLGLLQGPMVLVLGLAGALVGYSYTGSPLKLKYRGLGAPAVFLIYGPMIALGAFYVQAQHFSWDVLALSIPMGLLTTCILHSNDIRDMSYDKAAGIKTLSLGIGRRGAELVYNGMLYGAYVALLVMIVTRLLPVWSLVGLASLPVAFQLTRTLADSKGGSEGIRLLDQQSAQLHTQFSVLMLASLWLPLLFQQGVFS
jgi:1,4-dihydroxy-2-naphthoate octaprenyltransferase